MIQIDTSVGLIDVLIVVLIVGLKIWLAFLKNPEFSSWGHAFYGLQFLDMTNFPRSLKGGHAFDGFRLLGMTNLLGGLEIEACFWRTWAS